MTRIIRGLSEIADQFDAFLIDQFGVLHDGRAAFPGARECLERIAARGAPMVALTNSGKRSAANAARLDRLGFPPALFRGVISSGELARERLTAMVESAAFAPGARALMISRDGDEGLLDGARLTRAALGEDADLVIIAGAEPERMSREAYRIALAPLARRGVPALCANPDHVMYVDGEAGFGAGLIAADYEAAGGTVEMLGKPGLAMFTAGLSALGDPPPERVLMIGDSPAHDVAGAQGVGCAALWITEGVQAAGAGGPAAEFAMRRLVWSP